MLRRLKDTDDLHRRDQVIAVKAIKDIPEGASGTVKAVVGQAWRRYLVHWDSGEWIGTIDGTQIVRSDRVALFHERELERAAQAAKASEHAEVAATAAPADEGGDGRIPAHLLERSRNARARKESAAPA